MTTARADVWQGDTVWLVARTLSAPAVCYGQPRAAVVRTDWPYLVLSVAGEEHRVHADNVRRSDPNRDEPKPTRPGPRPVLPDGCEEMPLW